MKKSNILFAGSLVVFACIAVGAAWYMGAFSARSLPTGQPIEPATVSNNTVNSNEVVVPANPTPTTVTPRAEVTEFVRELQIPWAMAWTSPDRLLVTERPGRLREVVGGKLNPNALLTFDEVAVVGEAGLMGLVIDPEYASNHYIYVSLAYKKEGNIFIKVERLKDENGRVTRDKVLVDSIPGGQYHAGARLAFGPDTLLYVTTGDGTERARSQDNATLAGKILRMTRDGELPQGQTSLAIMKGIRNSQGLTFLNNDNVLLVDHGPSVFDGPAGGDEVNIGKLGGSLDSINFGWPVVSHEKTKVGMITPQIVFTPAVAPASAILYKGSLFPTLKGNVFIGLLKGEGILHVVLEETNGTYKVASYSKIEDVNIGRVRDIVEGPDGALYVTTSNTDGRGTIREGDDKIYKITLK